MKRACLCTMLFVCAAGCSRSGPDRELERRVLEEASRGAGTVVRMATLTGFAWDRLHIFDPYTMRDRIEAELGFAWPEADRTGIDSSDGMALLVFVKDGAVVRYVAQRRWADFAGQHRRGGYAPADAAFRVTPRGDGAFLMVAG